MTNTINIGERKIDPQHRVRLGKDMCDAYGLHPGDRVEIQMRKVEK